MSIPVHITVMPEYKPRDQAPEGYLQWHEWAEVQYKSGLIQKQCGNCGKFKFPQELSDKTMHCTLNKKGGIKPGLNDYELRINRDVICTFQHERELGLGACLAKAAMAALDYERNRNDRIYNELIHYLNDR